MERFEIYTLGCGSAKPSVRHNPSCTIVNHRDTLYMIDCGEGAQQQMQRMKLRFSRLRHIFLTHLHGDHVFGLPGLIGTLALSGVGGKITIHTFEEGKRILTDILGFFSRELPIDIEFNILNPEGGEIALETDSMTIRTVKLCHRINAVGFIFEEKPRLRHIIREATDFHKVPISMMNSLRQGNDFIKPDGSIIPNRVLTTDPSPSFSYAHISDTLYIPELASEIGKVDLLFHETTYLEGEIAEAKQRFHSTAKQAAQLAKNAGVRRLITGHYSSRYRDESDFLKEAREIFPDTILGREGLRIPLSDTRTDY